MSRGRSRLGRWARAAAWSLAAAFCLLLCVEAGLRAGVSLWRFIGAKQAAPFPVYVVGESTAYGEPFAPKISFPRLMSLMLGRSIRGRPMEIVNLAEPGSNTVEQYWRLHRELSLRPRRGGVVLIYVGVNETGLRSPSLLWRLPVCRSWLVSKLLYMLSEARGQDAGPDYEHRLEGLVALARGRGLPVVLSTLAGNMRDFPPQGGAEAERLYETARTSYAAGDYARAKSDFQGVADLERGLRPTSAQNEAIRRVALRFGAALTDSRRLFEAEAPHGVPGRELFVDAHHPSLRGYIVLARGFARQLSRLLNTPIERGEWSESEVRRALGFGAEDQREVEASRFIWYCGEASLRWDPEPLLSEARRYLALCERRAGRRLAPYRLLLALVAGDRGQIAYWAGRRDWLGREPEALADIGRNATWGAALLERSGLDGDLAAEVRRILDDAARLRGGPEGHGPIAARPRP